jgi:hypothetical protein
VVARLAAEFRFEGLGIARTPRNAKVLAASVTGNYTTTVNAVSLCSPPCSCGGTSAREAASGCCG